MSLTAPPPPRAPQPLRWTVEAYQQLVRSGAFAMQQRVELIDGEIIEHMPPDPPHSSGIDFTRAALAQAFQSVLCYLRTENPIALSGSQPQPDVAVVRGTPANYRNRFPTAADVLLIIEIADSSLAYDRTTKRDVYAAAGINEYWIVNVRERQLEVFCSPHNGVYIQTSTFAEEDGVAPLAAPDAAVTVRDLLP